MARMVSTVTIAAGASLSGETQVDRGELVGVILPARWTPASIGFMAHAPTSAYPQDTFLPLVDSAAAAVVLSDPTTAGTNQQTTLTETGAPTGGTFKLTINGAESGAINANSSAAAAKTVLEALLGVGNVDTSGGTLDAAPIVITFKGALMEQAVTVAVTSAALTGGAAPVVTPTTTTASVAATVRYIGVADAAKALRTLGRIKVRSGTNAAPVVQTEARTIGLVILLDD